jgi:hypothetical protein
MFHAFLFRIRPQSLTEKSDGKKPKNGNDMLIANDWNEEERREQKRYTLENYLRVIDRATNTLLGHVVDISAGGMKLLTDIPIAHRREYRLLLEVSLNGERPQKLAMTARSTWTDRDINPGLYNTGFYFLWLSPEARLRIDQLIHFLGDDQAASLSNHAALAVPE